MIKINNDVYYDYIINISWHNCEKRCGEELLIGKAPYIEFQILDHIDIGIEFDLYKEMLKSMELNSKICITKYISDILYKKDNGWASLVNQRYDCNIMRLNKNDFQFDLYLQKNDINIEISTSLSLL